LQSNPTTTIKQARLATWQQTINSAWNGKLEEKLLNKRQKEQAKLRNNTGKVAKSSRSQQ
jgi:hypothetical protein